jgi:hypothetical protein
MSAAKHEELLTAKEGACARCEPEAVAKVKKALERIMRRGCRAH